MKDGTALACYECLSLFIVSLVYNDLLSIHYRLKIVRAFIREFEFRIFFVWHVHMEGFFRFFSVIKKKGPYAFTLISIVVWSNINLRQWQLPLSLWVKQQYCGGWKIIYCASNEAKAILTISSGYAPTGFKFSTEMLHRTLLFKTGTVP